VSGVRRCTPQVTAGNAKQSWDEDKVGSYLMWMPHVINRGRKVERKANTQSHEIIKL
jgi:hypothetical protein